MPKYLSSDAEISPCGTYRYSLVRRWGVGHRSMLFIGLNPSTADANQDDPTIRRCVGFARAAGCDALVMANLFALRSTSPKMLKAVADPVGPDNDAWLDRLWAGSTIRVGAWGNWGKVNGRGELVATKYPDLECYGVTASGEPRHPLYLPAIAPRVRYRCR